MGEASICPLSALVAAAYICQRSACYGSQAPDHRAMAVARSWQWMPDPSLGARFLVSAQDLRLPRVQALTSDRGPPLREWACAGGLALYAFP